MINDEPIDTIELRKTPAEEKLVGKVRGPLLTTAKVALPLIGAALFGPVGLGVGTALRVGVKILDQKKGSLGKKAVKSAGHGLFAAAVGTLGLIPGPLGLGVKAIALHRLLKISGKVQERSDPYTIKFEKFAKAYVPKVEAKLNQKVATDSTGVDSSSQTKELTPAQREKIAAQSILAATKVCCEQLSPTVAVAIAREVAKELILAGSAQEDVLEILLTKDESVPLTDVLNEKPEDTEASDQILLSSFKSSSPAAATAQHVLLRPEFVAKHSAEAITVTTGHELSHVAHRDVVGNMGDKTLKTAIQAAGDQDFSLSAWRNSDQTLEEIELASAELSRVREFRCDKEGAEYALAQGVSPEQVSQGLKDVLGTGKSKLDPKAEHPINSERFAAIAKVVDSQSELKLLDFGPNAPSLSTKTKQDS